MLRVAITGPPCSGKKSVASHLSQAFGLPIVSAAAPEHELLALVCSPCPPLLSPPVCARVLSVMCARVQVRGEPAEKGYILLDIPPSLTAVRSLPSFPLLFFSAPCPRLPVLLSLPTLLLCCVLCSPLLFFSPPPPVSARLFPVLSCSSYLDVQRAALASTLASVGRCPSVELSLVTEPPEFASRRAASPDAFYKGYGTSCWSLRAWFTSLFTLPCPRFVLGRGVH